MDPQYVAGSTHVGRPFRVFFLDTGEFMAVKHFDFDHTDHNLQEKPHMLQNEITILNHYFETSKLYH